MPKVEDQFAGHFYPGDPRTPVFGAIGCTWPTIPAFRYRAQSDNATVAFVELNGDGLLLTFNSSQPAHDFIEYRYDGTGEILWITAKKFQLSQDNGGYRWRIDMELACLEDPVFKRSLFNGEQKCNVDVPVGNMGGVPDGFGNSGNTFALNQVLWDEELPPE